MIDNIKKDFIRKLISLFPIFGKLCAFDLEQSGAGFDDDAVTQVAINHVDPNKSNMDLEINMRLNFGYFLLPYVLIKVLNKSYFEIQQATLSFNQGIKVLENYITKQLNGMTILCHNAHRFDIPRLNQYLYKNLRNPWPFTQKNNIDVLDSINFWKDYMAYNPDFLIKKENGDYTCKLEYISKNFEGENFIQSHDAKEDNFNNICNLASASNQNIDFFKVVSEQFDPQARLAVLEKNPIVAATSFSKYFGADLKLFMPLCKSSWNNYFYLIRVNEDDPFDEQIESLIIIFPM